VQRANGRLSRGSVAMTRALDSHGLISLSEALAPSGGWV